MKKLALFLMMMSSSWIYAADLNLDDQIKSFDETLAELSKKASSASDGKRVGFFILTKDNKLIRVYSVVPNARGSEINSKVSQEIISKGFYKGENVELPEINTICDTIVYKLDKEKGLGIAVSTGCKKLK